MERNKIRKIYFSIVVASAVLITGLSIACSNENDALDLQLLEKQSEQKQF